MNAHADIAGDWVLNQQRAQEAAREVERVEQEQARTLLRERQERQRKPSECRLPKPRTAEEKRIHAMRLEYKRMGIPVDF